MSRGGRPPIPEEDLLDELRRLADELGRTPGMKMMSERGAYSGRVYPRRFGSWNEAVEAAGLEPNPQGGPLPTEEELLDELHRLGDELGHTPTHREMREQGNQSPSAYMKRFGSWNEAVEAAGFTPNPMGGHPKHQHLIEQLREAEQ